MSAAGRPHPAGGPSWRSPRSMAFSRRSLLVLAMALSVFVASTIGTFTVAQEAPKDAAGEAMCPNAGSKGSAGGAGSGKKDRAGAPPYVPQEPSEKAVSDIPPEMLKAYRGAGKKYGIDWTILAGVGAKESDHGRNAAEGGGNETGAAQGPMQFTPGTFASQGVDGNGDGAKDATDPEDAVYSAANYLKNEGAPEDYVQALTAYNGDPAYADDVVRRADEYKAAAEEDGPGKKDGKGDGGGRSGTAALVLSPLLEASFAGPRPAHAAEADRKASLTADARGKGSDGLFQRSTAKQAREDAKEAREDARDDAKDARDDARKDARKSQEEEQFPQGGAGGASAGGASAGGDATTSDRTAELPPEQAQKIFREQELPPEDRSAPETAPESSPEDDGGAQRQVPGPCEKQPPARSGEHPSREPRSSETRPSEDRPSEDRSPEKTDSTEPGSGDAEYGDGDSGKPESGKPESGKADSKDPGSGDSKGSRKADEGGREAPGGDPSGDAEELANDPNFDGSEQAKQDLRDGLVDPRLVKSLREVTKKHKVTIPWFKTGHSFDGSGQDGPTIDGGYGSAGGLPNTHYYGRAVDVFDVDDKPVEGNPDDPDVLDVLKTLEGMPGKDRPDQMIAPTETSATMAADREKGYIMEPDQQALHDNHLHLGYMRETGTNNTY